MAKANNGKRIIIGNWKMNPSNLKDAQKWFGSISELVSRAKTTEVVICPPFIYLESLKKISKKVSVGAQNANAVDVGPFTGEVSALMLYNMGIKYSILGHSERRAMGETSVDVNKKIKSALFAGITPIVCIGEKERDESHEYFNVVKTQVKECLAGVSKNSFNKIIIAYEPVWALSSTLNRRDATAFDSHEMSLFIKKVLSDLSSPEIASSVRIIYGGSVNERDAGEFLEHGGVVGLLAGKASMDPKKFGMIVNICEALKN